MKAHRFLLTALAVTVAFAGSANAQDVNGPNAILSVQSLIASSVDPVGHNVTVPVPGLFNLKVDSGANSGRGIIMLGSTLNPTFNVLPTPWGGGIDLGTFVGGPAVIANVFVIGNGVTPAGFLDFFFITNGMGDFELQTNVAAQLSGQHLATQAIVQDPTNPPFNLDNTEAANSNFVAGQQLIVMTNDDGQLPVSFAGGKTFNFHGLNYSQVWIEGNGNVNFGGQNSLAATGFFVDDHQTWTGGTVPGIAPFRVDWNPVAASLTDGVLYEEVGNTLRISWGDPLAQTNGGIAHFGDTDVNNFELIMELDPGAGGNPNEGNFQINIPFLDQNTIIAGDGLIGHTPGAPVAGGALDTHVRYIPGFAGPGVAQVEEHKVGAVATDLGFDGLGARRGYNNAVSSWTGAVIDFIPNPAISVAGDQGYTSLPSGAQVRDDVQSLSQNTLSDMGGETVTINGSFVGFDPTASGAGTVVFDPSGLAGGPFPGIVIGVLDDTGGAGVLSLPNPQPNPIRDGQGLVIITPPLALGTLMMQVNFASGAVRSIPVSVVSPTTLVTTYALADDGFQNHVLNMPLAYYGQNFNSLNLCSNGYITFGAGSGDFTPALATFFGGFAAAPNPAVGLMYSDLNRGGTGIYEVREDLTTGEVICDFRNQNWWGSSEPAGQVVCTFNSAATGPGGVVLDYTNWLPATLNPDNFIMGVTNGDQTMGTDTNLTPAGGFGAILPGGYLTGTGDIATGGTVVPGGTTPDSVAEEVTANTPLTSPSPMISFIESGIGGNWFIM